jgi:hypothetical protein
VYPNRPTVIKFDEGVRDAHSKHPEVTLRVPGPRDRENGNSDYIETEYPLNPY